MEPNQRSGFKKRGLRLRNAFARLDAPEASTSVHLRNFRGFVNSIIHSEFADLFKDGDRKRSKWSDACDELMNLTSDVQRLFRGKTAIAALRHAVGRFEKIEHDMHRIIYGLGDDAEDEWEQLMLWAHRALVNALISLYRPEHQERAGLPNGPK